MRPFIRQCLRAAADEIDPLLRILQGMKKFKHQPLFEIFWGRR